MEKYKICPNPKCGKHNKSKAIECLWCETDLSGVKPTDDETEALRAQAESEKAAEETSGAGQARTMTRICESCGTHNPAAARKCTSCGEDISDVIPVPDSADSSVICAKYELQSLDGSFSFCVPDGVTLIGRENEMKEYLASKSYVSRKHAELENVDGKLLIKNLNKTNYTYVNNEKVLEDASVELHEGDEIGLGGNITNGERQELAAYFKVRIV